MNTQSQLTPDMDMAVHYALGDDGLIWLFHDKPFTKTLSWIEYNANTSHIDFILEDGDLRNFGIPIDPTYAPKLKAMHTIPVILRQNDEVIDGEYYPLILHTA